MAGTHVATESIEIAAGVDDIVRVVADLDAYPEWADNLDSIEVLKADEDGYPVHSRMTLDVVIRKVTIELDYIWDYPDAVRWTARPGGDVKHLDGCYAFAPKGDARTLVTYTLEIEPNFKVPGFMMDKARTSIARSALKGLKLRAEAEAGA